VGRKGHDAQEGRRGGVSGARATSVVGASGRRQRLRNGASVRGGADWDHKTLACLAQRVAPALVAST